ncbi:hypothetical protein Bbelb_057880 [Branchiostoma belcheri]|nr:hypothetical protein Bbelb_057880 [Branchiostoma belcheri]
MNSQERWQSQCTGLSANRSWMGLSVRRDASDDERPDVDSNFPQRRRLWAEPLTNRASECSHVRRIGPYSCRGQEVNDLLAGADPPPPSVSRPNADVVPPEARSEMGPLETGFGGNHM